jgi:hypothetical protein
MTIVKAICSVCKEEVDVFFEPQEYLAIVNLCSCRLEEMSGFECPCCHNLSHLKVVKKPSMDEVEREMREILSKKKNVFVSNNLFKPKKNYVA